MRFTLLAGAALCALLSGSPAAAQTTSADQNELASLIRAQAGEIAALRARLDAMEAGVPVATAPAQAPASSTALQVPGLVRSEVVGDDVPSQTFATNIVRPGPADQSVGQARADAINAAGVTTEWRGGLPIFRSPDGTFVFKMRGRIISHASTTFGSDYDGRNITTTGLRAARIGIEGAAGPNFFYQFENDFGDNVSDIGTAFVGWRDTLGDDLSYDVRFGNMFNDRSFEGSGGSDAPPFLERNVVATAIIPQRGFYGIALMPRLFWDGGHASLTVSGDFVDNRQQASDTRTVMGRIHLNPVKSDRSVLHLGLWGFDEQLAEGAGALTRNTVIGGRFNGALRVSSGTLAGGKSTRGYGAELGGYVGGLWLMGEAGSRDAALDGGRPDFESRAWSLSTGYFLTGELPPYNARLGTFAQPRVLRPALRGGPGAVEVLARYENIDYSGVPTAGDGWAATAGVNWYLDNVIRLQFNLIHWNANNRSGAYIGEDTGQTVSGGIGVTF
ncbi:OprO/OprP family phosphate-selective porin [Brevundimonas sp. R86498]|uniref:OprO/OprP family phosphate-selective porin n=1 Tax=Brevundimonas sp. R86498 TaxID=3093845 RepID=UPI0037CBBDCD